VNQKIVGLLFCTLIFTFSSVIAIELSELPNKEGSWLNPGVGSKDSQFSYSTPDLTFTSGAPSVTGYAQDIIIYTAHQNWLSRIYLLRMNGSVINYYEYEFYFFADLEVVNNEAYAAEAFAPRAYKINLETGELDLIIDDWTLYYFYDLAFDGTYFYVKEWDLNRYDINGNKAGTASFDESVNGGAWDGTCYWTLTDGNQIKCWDISGWPTLTEVPDNSFNAPSPDCRGLWFDGQYFWTAESIEGTLGNIYQFDYHGEVINQWVEPAFKGWSACVIKASDFPQIPETPSGPAEGQAGVEYDFSSHTTDPEEDSLFYLFDWGDGTESDWLGPYPSGDTCTASYAWINPGVCYVKAKAKDTYDHQSDWSDSLSITVYTCGDCNSDAVTDLGDVLHLINYLYKSGPAPDPLQAGDVDNNGTVDLGDVLFLINYLFKNGPPPCD